MLDTIRNHDSVLILDFHLMNYHRLLLALKQYYFITLSSYELDVYAELPVFIFYVIKIIKSSHFSKRTLLWRLLSYDLDVIKDIEELISFKF